LQLKIYQNVFAVRALPWTPLGELSLLPRPCHLVGWGGRHPSPFVIHVDAFCICCPGTNYYKHETQEL